MQRGFMAARRDFFDRLDFAVSYPEGGIKIVYRGADVARKQIENFPDGWAIESFSYGDREMLFARREWREFGVSNNYAGRHTGVGRNGLVSSIAGDNAWMRMTHHSGSDEGRGAVAVFRGKLLEAGGIAIDDGSRRDAMEEVAAAQAFVGKRSGKCGSA